MIRELVSYLRGWAGYFGFSQWHELQSLDGWIRRRLRCVALSFAKPPSDKNQDEHDASRFRADLAQLICRFFVDRRCSSCLWAGRGGTPELPLLRGSFAIRAQQADRQAKSPRHGSNLLF
jgi:Group II intron, maturase-specific domain